MQLEDARGREAIEVAVPFGPPLAAHTPSEQSRPPHAPTRTEFCLHGKGELGLQVEAYFFNK